VSYAELKVLGRNDSVVDKMRLRFAAGMETALPEPLASFALGLLIGQRSTLPDKINDQLSAVGLTHVIAVSGYNLTIIVRAMRGFGKKRSKYQVTVLSIALILGFLLVTGFSASIVRAAIVSILSLVAGYYGRTFRPLLLLSVAAVATVAWSPIYLWSDIGWYLSFLAFYGIIVLVPLFIKRLYGARVPHALTLLLFETMAAQIMTLPLILYIFGVTSTVALLSNVLIVPLVPLGMLLALFAGLAGMFVSVIAGWIAWPAKILLTYMLDVVSIFSKIPHATITTHLSTANMVCLYACLALVSFVLWRKGTKKYATITEKEILE
jgi:competence protein ComEC